MSDIYQSQTDKNSMAGIKKVSDIIKFKRSLRDSSGAPKLFNKMNSDNKSFFYNIDYLSKDETIYDINLSENNIRNVFDGKGGRVVDYNMKIPSTSNSVSKHLKSMDLYPFRIINLMALLYYYQIDYRYESYLKGTSTDYLYRIVKIKCTGEEDYLPVGDIIFPMNMPAENVPVLLIKNDSKYCTRIDNSDWKWLGDSYDCKNYFFTSPPLKQSYYYIDNYDNYKNDYVVMGSITKKLDDTNDNKYVYAAVKKKYLSKNFKNAFKEYYLGYLNCYHRFHTAYSNPFFNFRMATTTSSLENYEKKYKEEFDNPISTIVGAVTGAATSAISTFTDSTSPSIYNADAISPMVLMSSQNGYYDIIPEILIAKCCSDNLPSEISRNLYCGNYEKTDDNNCSDSIRNICSDNNSKLLDDDIIAYFKKQDVSFKDNMLQTFCQNDSNRNLPNFNKACSCFLSRDEYIRWRDNLLKNLDQTSSVYLKIIQGEIKPPCDYPDCVASNVKPYGSKGSDCSQNIQFCLTKSNVDSGVSSNSPVTTQQANNCVFGPGGGNSSYDNTSRPTSVPSADTSKSNKDDKNETFFEKNKTAFYIGIGFFVFVIILIVIILIVKSGSSGYDDNYGYYGIGKSKRTNK